MEQTTPVSSPPSTPGVTCLEKKPCEGNFGSPFVTPPITPPVKMEEEAIKFPSMTESASTDMFASPFASNADVVDAPSGTTTNGEVYAAVDADLSTKETNPTPSADFESQTGPHLDTEIDQEDASTAEYCTNKRTASPHEQHSSSPKPTPCPLTHPETPTAGETHVDIGITLVDQNENDGLAEEPNGFSDAADKPAKHCDAVNDTTLPIHNANPEPETKKAPIVVEAHSPPATNTDTEEELPSSPPDLPQERRRPPPITTNITVDGIVNTSFPTIIVSPPFSCPPEIGITPASIRGQEPITSSSSAEPPSSSPPHASANVEPRRASLAEGNGDPDSPLAHRGASTEQQAPTGLMASRHCPVPNGLQDQVFNPQTPAFNPQGSTNGTTDTNAFPRNQYGAQNFNGFNPNAYRYAQSRAHIDVLRNLNGRIHWQQGHIAHLEAQIRSLRNSSSRALEAQKEQAAAVASDLLASLYKSQIEVLSHKADIEREARDLNMRRASEKNVEKLLVVGQRVLHSKLNNLESSVEGVCGDPRLNEDGEVELRRAELEMLKAREVAVEVEKAKMEVRREMREREASLDDEKEKIRLREKVLALREKHYAATVKEYLESAITDRVASEMKVQVREEAFREGFLEGKKTGVEEAGRVAFVKGFEAAVRQNLVLGRFRDGEIGGEEFEKELLASLQMSVNGGGAATANDEMPSTPPAPSTPVPATIGQAEQDHNTTDDQSEKDHNTTVPAPEPIDLLNGTTLTPASPSYVAKPRRTLFQELNGVPSAAERELQLKHKLENERKEREAKDTKAPVENGTAELGGNADNDQQMEKEKVEELDLIML